MLPPLASWVHYQIDRIAGFLSRRGVNFAPLPDPKLEYNPQRLACRAAIVDIAQLVRVTSCGFGRRVEDEVATLKAMSYLEHPLKIYRLGEATIFGGLILSKAGRHYLGKHHPTAMKLLQGEGIEGPRVLPNSMQGLHYFGHWLGDDCSAFEAFRGHEGLISMVRPPWTDAPVYQELFNQDWKEFPVLRSKDLTLLRDIGFSREKANRYRRLRESMRRRFKSSIQDKRVVFIRRGVSASTRNISNGLELEERLQAAGVVMVIPEKNTEQFIRKILDASLIISVEGSQSRHAIYALREGGGLLVLQPPDRFYAAPQEWMRCLDMYCGFVIGSQTETGFRIEPGEVLSMIDRLLALTENHSQA